MKSSEACGKFILGGEHSILHKGCALGFPLGALKLEVTESDHFDGLRINGEDRSESEFKKILELRKIVGAKTEVRGFEVRSQIPIGAGLGSSAALCAAIAKIHRQNDDMESIAYAALQGERLFHGQSSGIDPYSIAVGKPIVYRAATRKWRALNTSKFKAAGLCFALKDSGLRHKTSEVTAAVTKVRGETPLIWEDLIDALATNAENMIRAFEDGSVKDLGRLMNDSHFRLLQLGVSNERLDEAAEELKAKGAIGAKLTGAGRGGFVLGLFKKEDLDGMRADGGVIIPELD